MYRPPPEPVANPSADWADRYARWYEEERGPEYRADEDLRRLEKRVADLERAVERLCNGMTDEAFAILRGE